MMFFCRNEKNVQIEYLDINMLSIRLEFMSFPFHQYPVPSDQSQPQVTMQEIISPFLFNSDYIDIPEDSLVIPVGMEIHETPSPYFPGKSIYDQGSVASYTGNHFPHWELENTVYHACFHLIDSVPIACQETWQKERREILDSINTKDANLTQNEIRRLQFLYSEKISQFLDSGYGSCILKQKEAAKIVMDSLTFYNYKKYVLHAWCIMPNHVHVIFQPYDQSKHSEIIHGWKSYTAHAINRALGHEGTLWQVDTYNHIIRSKEEYYQQIRYVWNNPDKAGLWNWPWRWMCLDK